MAISASTVFEVRTTGSDNNGGGFVTGSGGTDYSQADTAHASGTDLTVDGTTNTKVTSASHTFDSTDVGNLIQITAGAGFTTGFYQVVSVASGAATLDRSPAAVGTSGGTWALGGALASPGKAASAHVAGNIKYIRSGTYNITTSSTNVSGGCILDGSGGVGSGNGTTSGRWIGYGTTRGDNSANRPVWKLGNSVSNATIWKNAAQACRLENISFDGNNQTNAVCVDTSGHALSSVERCDAKNATTGFKLMRGDEIGIYLSATGCTTGFSVTGRLRISTATGNSVGIEVAAGKIWACIAYSNSSHGFMFDNVTSEIIGCTSYGNSGDGFNGLNGGSGRTSYLLNCVAINNGGYGFSPDTNREATWIYNCAGYNNTSGNTNSSSAIILNFIVLTASPFTNAAGGDFSLNNTAGGGAALRAAGIPGTFPGNTTIGYLDIGAAQHQDSGGGGTTIIINAGGLGRLGS